MPKPRTCEHCNTVIPLDRGFYFDKDLNLICGICGEIICPTEEETTTVGNHNHVGNKYYGSYD